ncbi:MAG: hypothetical protein ACRCRU_00345 [Vibrio sp.]|uniref:hypothetical protein n=1 Tax=Vibrio sp. TaxID=678 RepID=UPI003F3CBC87
MPITNVNSISSVSKVSAAQRPNGSETGKQIAESMVAVCQASEKLPMTQTGQMGFDGLTIAAAGAGAAMVGTLLESKAVTAVGFGLSAIGLSMAAYSTKIQDQTTLVMQQQMASKK